MRSIHQVFRGAASALPYGEVAETSDALDALDGSVQAIDDTLGMGWAQNFGGYHWEISPLHNPPIAPAAPAGQGSAGELGAADMGGGWDSIMNRMFPYTHGQPNVAPGTVVEVFRDGSGRASDGMSWHYGFGPGSPYRDGTRGPGFAPGRYSVRGPSGDIYRMMHRVGTRAIWMEPARMTAMEPVPIEFRRDPSFVHHWRDPSFRVFYRDPWFRHYWGMPEFRTAWGRPGFAAHWHHPEFRRNFDRPEFRHSWHTRPEFRVQYEHAHPLREGHGGISHLPEHHEHAEHGSPGLPSGEHGGHASPGLPPAGGHGGGAPPGGAHASPPGAASPHVAAHASPQAQPAPVSHLSTASPARAASTWSGPKVAPHTGMHGVEDDDMGRSFASRGISSYGHGGSGYGHGGGFGRRQHLHALAVASATAGVVLSQLGGRVTVHFDGAPAPSIVPRATLHPLAPYLLPPGARVTTTADVGAMGAAEQYLEGAAEHYRPGSWRRRRIEREREEEREREREREEWERREHERFHGHARLIVHRPHVVAHHLVKVPTHYAHGRVPVHYEDGHFSRSSPQQIARYGGGVGELGLEMGAVGDPATAADAHRAQQIDCATHNALQAARAQISVARESLWDKIVAAAAAGEAKLLATLRASARALFALAYRVVGSADAAVAVATASPHEIQALAELAQKGSPIPATAEQYQAMITPEFVKATPGAALPAKGAPAPIAPRHAEVKHLPVGKFDPSGDIVIDPIKAAAHASLSAIPTAAPPSAASAEPASTAAAPVAVPAALAPVTAAPASPPPASPPPASPPPMPPLELPLLDEEEEDGGYTPPLAEIDAGPPRVRCGPTACEFIRSEDSDEEDGLAPAAEGVDELEQLDDENASPAAEGADELEQLDDENASPAAEGVDELEQLDDENASPAAEVDDLEEPLAGLDDDMGSRGGHRPRGASRGGLAPVGLPAMDELEPIDPESEEV